MIRMGNLVGVEQIRIAVGQFGHKLQSAKVLPRKTHLPWVLGLRHHFLLIETHKKHPGLMKN